MRETKRPSFTCSIDLIFLGIPKGRYSSFDGVPDPETFREICQFGYEEMVQLYLDRGVRIEGFNGNNIAKIDNPRILDLLISRGVSLQGSLHTAITEEYSDERIEMLLARGADPNESVDDLTMFETALYFDRLDLAKTMYKKYNATIRPQCIEILRPKIERILKNDTDESKTEGKDV
jgi:hypothetical protein